MAGMVPRYESQLNEKCWGNTNLYAALTLGCLFWKNKIVVIIIKFLFMAWKQLEYTPIVAGDYKRGDKLKMFKVQVS